MELSEAKKECKKIIEEYLSSSMIIKNGESIPPVRIEFTDRQSEAIDTVLKVLDNSISKDEVRNLDVIDISGFECVALEDIQELLGE